MTLFSQVIRDRPYDVFVPRDVNLSLKYVDWAMNEAEKRGISVLLDLHGAPGSQNGFDHRWLSERVIEWNLWVSEYEWTRAVSEWVYMGEIYESVSEWESVWEIVTEWF